MHSIAFSFYLCGKKKKYYGRTRSTLTRKQCLMSFIAPKSCKTIPGWMFGALHADETDLNVSYECRCTQ